MKKLAKENSALKYLPLRGDPRRDPEHTPFTRYLRALDRDDPPCEDLLGEVWKQLRRLLRRVLIERGLWQRSPSFLGIIGWSRWQESSSRVGRREDALEELATDAYIFIFEKRLASLLAQLRHKPQIEGLIALNVRHFVHGRQQRHDALGRRTYTVLRDAAERAVRAGELHGVTNQGRIRSDSVLAFEADEEAEPITDQEQIAAVVRGWADRLIPGLVTATGNGYRRVIDNVCCEIGGLPTVDIHAFRLGDLCRPLARDIRTRWWTLWDDHQPLPMGENMSSHAPDRELAAREHFEMLADRVEKAIDQEARDQETRWLMTSIWRMLIGWANENPLPETESGSRTRNQSLESKLIATAGEPSQRAIGRALGVSRGRVATAWGKLAVIVRQCRAQLASRRGPQRDAAGQLPGSVLNAGFEARTLRTHLHQRAASAAELARHDREAMRLAPRAVGDVFIARDQAEPRCEWVVVEISPTSTKVLIVPADTSCWTDRRSLTIAEDEPGGPLVLRCTLARWVEQSRLAEHPSRRLSREAVDAARRLITAISTAPSSAPEDESSSESDLGEWLAVLGTEADALATDKRSDPTRDPTA